MTKWPTDGVENIIYRKSQESEWEDSDTAWWPAEKDGHSSSSWSAVGAKATEKVQAQPEFAAVPSAADTECPESSAAQKRQQEASKDAKQEQFDETIVPLSPAVPSTAGTSNKPKDTVWQWLDWDKWKRVAVGNE